MLLLLHLKLPDVQGPVVVLGGGAFLTSKVPLYAVSHVMYLCTQANTVLLPLHLKFAVSLSPHLASFLPDPAALHAKADPKT